MTKFYLGCVWIELILLKLKTENEKHCSKIIFKCVNSIVGPIFNFFFLNKVVVGAMNNALCLLHNESICMNRTVAVNKCRKKKKKRETQNADAE